MTTEEKKIFDILDNDARFSTTGYQQEGDAIWIDNNEELSKRIAALFSAEMEKVKEEAYMEGYNCTREEGQLYHQLQKAVEKNEELFEQMEKKDAEIADLKFTAYARLQQIDLLEKRVAELEAMMSAFESINSIKNIHLDNRKAKWSKYI